MAELEFAHIHKQYKDSSYAVRDFNLKIENGEFVVLVGPSGCGKTTLLRMIAGLESVTAGEILADGFVINDLEPKKRNVAMVFQNYALFPNMTVYENIGFPLKMKRIPKKERQKKILKIAEMLDIVDLLERKAKKLSGGQCQRIAIGRALVCEPQFFLLDEPLANIDSRMRMQLREEIARLHRQTNVTTIYVTHDQVEAMSLGDKIVVMDKGIIQQADTPQNIYYKPANTFVAQYIGERPMNIFKAKCVSVGSQLLLQTPNGDIALPKQKKAALENKDCCGRDVLVGIRAENIYLSEEDARRDTDGLLGCLSVRVDSAEIFGGRSVVHFSLGEAMAVADFHCVKPINIGEMMDIYLSAENIHIFDCETKEAIVH